MKALQIVAAALGKSMGGITVRVDEQAPTAYTNGKTVVLPVLPILEADEKADVTLGLVCHEAFHIRYTYMGGRLDGMPPKGIAITPFKKRLQNALEDARIENLGFKQYRGARRFLDSLVAFAIKESWFDVPEEEKPGNLVLFGLLYHYRAHFLGQHALDDIAALWAVVARETFGEVLWGQMVAIADKAVVGEGPDAPWLAADKICGLLSSEVQDQSSDSSQDSNPRQEGLGGADSQPGDGSGSDDDSGSQSGASESDSEKEAQKKAAKQAVESGEEDLADTDLAKMVPKEGGNSSNDDDGQVVEVQPLCSQGQIATWLQPAQEEAKRIYRKICGPLEAKLWARSQEEEWVSRTGTGGVSSGHLYAAHTSGRVFKSLIEGESRSMTVHLLLDASGSMGDVRERSHRRYWSEAGALALGQLFSNLGVYWSASWFDDEYYSGRPYSTAPTSPKDPWLVVTGGCTNLAMGMSKAGQQLICESDTERKLLLVITDGLSRESQIQTIDTALLEQGVEVRYVLIALADQASGFAFAGDRASHGDLEDTAKAMIGAFRTFS